VFARTVIALFLIAASAVHAAPKRRSILPSARPHVITPADWLEEKAFRLQSTTLISDTSDLQPLRAVVGDADIVGLGDGTHGTHEFYTMKLRAIDYLVRELGFDIVAYELSFAVAEDLNAYVVDGVGDPRAILRRIGGLGYFFWDAEEILQVVEWMRMYNAHRGSRPPVQLAGSDVWDLRSSARAVVSYLRTVDPAEADAAENDYLCVLSLTGIYPAGCQQGPTLTVYNRLAARRGDLGTGNGAAAYETALQHARVITQSFNFSERDRYMALNLRWLHEVRSQTKRIIYWAHNEHVGKIRSGQTPSGSAGGFLQQAVGSEYVAIGTLTGTGQYMTWVRSSPVVYEVPSPGAGSYELYFQTGPRPAFLIPLRGAVPAWLSTPAWYFWAGVAPNEKPYLNGSLTQKFDAVIYVHATSPIDPLDH
jgi:erythromycin esterase